MGAILSRGLGTREPLRVVAGAIVRDRKVLLVSKSVLPFLVAQGLLD